MTDYSQVSDDELAAMLEDRRGERARMFEYVQAAGASKGRAEMLTASLADDAQDVMKEIHRRRAEARAQSSQAIEQAIVDAIGRDYEAMDDLAIKQAKSALYALRRQASPAQDEELRAEMIRAQAVLNVRGRARTLEFYRIAATTPGAKSAWVTGDVGTVTADAPPPDAPEQGA